VTERLTGFTACPPSGPMVEWTLTQASVIRDHREEVRDHREEVYDDHYQQFDCS
jgi:hypothetical protein